MRAQDQKIVVVTGGTGGIGLQTARTLAERGHHVIVTGRDAERGRAAVDAIRSAAGHDRVGLQLADLSVADEVDDLAGKIAADGDHIDVLINNAGAFNHDSTITTDGLELSYAVNVVAPWRLTLALGPQLAAAPAGRVVNVTGGGPFGGVDFARLGDPARSNGLRGYTNTKRAMEAMSLLLAERLRDDGVTVNVVYPGGANTAMTGGMVPADVPAPLRLLWPLMRSRLQSDDGGKSAAKASRSSVHAATSPDLAGVTGVYLSPNSKPRRFHRSVTDPATQRRLATLLEPA